MSSSVLILFVEITNKTDIAVILDRRHLKLSPADAALLRRTITAINHLTAFRTPEIAHRLAPINARTSSTTSRRSAGIEMPCRLIAAMNACAMPVDGIAVLLINARAGLRSALRKNSEACRRSSALR
jgi:hypothetical protein